MPKKQRKHRISKPQITPEAAEELEVLQAIFSDELEALPNGSGFRLRVLPPLGDVHGVFVSAVLICR